MTTDLQLTLTPIQILLSVLLLIVAIASLRLFRNRLLYRLFFIAIVFTGILFVAVPVLPVYLATMMGVGRGVDLVFYLLFIGFFFTTIVIYRRLLRFDETLTRLVRQNAIRNGHKLG